MAHVGSGESGVDIQAVTIMKSEQIDLMKVHGVKEIHGVDNMGRSHDDILWLGRTGNTQIPHGTFNGTQRLLLSLTFTSPPSKEVSRVQFEVAHLVVAQMDKVSHVTDITPLEKYSAQ